MYTPQLNRDDYAQSSVHNMTAFADANFLLAHGTADDNGEPRPLFLGRHLDPTRADFRLRGQCMSSTRSRSSTA
jgi:hypothetical protein